MNKKEYIVPLAFVALSLLFVIICTMVYISKGKSKRWVGWKMKIGALLLTMSFLTCSNNQIPKSIIPIATCYDLSNKLNPRVEIEVDSKNVIYGYIYDRFDRNYSYKIVNTNRIPIQENNLSIDKWPYDMSCQEFMIEVNEKLDTGSYQFKLFNCKLKKQDSTFVIHKYDFKIEK